VTVGAATAGGSRRLLRRLRDVMAADGSAQARLDRVPSLIAAEMVAEVCSVYLVRAGEILELFATEGLNQDAVHRTRLRVGEGLIGEVGATGRPVATADAWSHPKFAYRPETGEEPFRSLVGVPIRRAGRVVGVLAIQNRSERRYTDEEVETLETVAMVLAELAGGGELVDPLEALTDAAALAPRRLVGTALAPGIAVGVAYFHETRVVIRTMVAEDPAAERARLDRAVAGMRDHLDRLVDTAGLTAAGEHREILDSFRMIAADRGWLQRIGEAIAGGLTAEAAVQRIQEEMQARLRGAASPYMRERLQDLRELSGRLQSHLLGVARVPRDLPEDTILIARSMGPAALLDYDRGRLAGLIVEEASPTAHVAIVARALGLPAVGRAPTAIAAIEPGDRIVVDGDRGQVFVRPGNNVVDTVRAALAAGRARSERTRALKDAPPISRDGVRVALHMNAGLMLDLDQLVPSGADGIGLFRTELAFMVRAAWPDVATQHQLYRRVLDVAEARPVAFRTLDIGGDKRLGYFDTGDDENPALGWRAIRIGLDRPAILRQQLRALAQAAAGRDLRVMFPMIAEIDEFERARALLDRELGDLAQPPTTVAVGVMIEVPSLLWQLDHLLPRVDFLSVGSNDLFQFLVAADRGNPRLADRFDPLSPTFLTVLAELARRADLAGKPVTLCGEMAGRPLDALALAAIGFRGLSMTAPALGPVKQMLRSADLAQVGAFLAPRIQDPAGGLRAELRAFARDHRIAV
jgi:phosphotransferase system enzyme I (PtsP)